LIGSGVPLKDAGADILRRFLRRREDQVFFALCGVVGVGGELIGEGFKRALAFAWRTIFGGVDVPSEFAGLPAYAVVGIPCAGGLLAGLLLHYFRRASGGGHGVPEVMEIVVLGSRTLRFRSVLKKTAAAFCGIASGGSIGREGPIIQMTTAFSARLGAFLNLSEESYRILTAAGVAAGVAGAYHTPLAGVLFVVEIIVGAVNMRVLGAAGIAAVGAYVTGHALGHHHGAFFAPWSPAGGAVAADRAPEFVIATPLEYLAHAALGVACGVLAVAFMSSLRLSGALFQKLRLPIPAKTALGGLIVGCVGLAWPEIFGNGYETAFQILKTGFPVAALFWLVVLKIAATSSSVGSGVPGGVFTPTLMVGAACGALFGEGMTALFGTSVGPASSYAQLGLAGLLSGTMHAPLLATVMTVELMDDHGFAVPLLVVSFVARATARALSPSSIYTEELRKKGVQTEGPMQERVLRSLHVRDLLRADVPLVPAAASLDDVVRAFTESRALHLYVGDRDGRLVGAVDLHDVKGLLGGLDAAGVIVAADLVKEIPVAFPGETIVDVNRRLWLQDVGHLPVVASDDDRKFLGVVTRRDILGAVDRQILRQNVLMAPIVEADAASPDWFEIPPGGKLEGVRVPPSLVGKTVGASALGRTFGVTILAVSKRAKGGGEKRILPRSDIVLEATDRLVVIGPAAAVDRLARGELSVEETTDPKPPDPEP
jgi:chloride channel protein, CIC family